MGEGGRVVLGRGLGVAHGGGEHAEVAVDGPRARHAPHPHRQASAAGGEEVVEGPRTGRVGACGADLCEHGHARRPGPVARDDGEVVGGDGLVLGDGLVDQADLELHESQPGGEGDDARVGVDGRLRHGIDVGEAAQLAVEEEHLGGPDVDEVLFAAAVLHHLAGVALGILEAALHHRPQRLPLGGQRHAEPRTQLGSHPFEGSDIGVEAGDVGELEAGWCPHAQALRAVEQVVGRDRELEELVGEAHPLLDMDRAGEADGPYEQRQRQRGELFQ